MMAACFRLHDAPAWVQVWRLDLDDTMAQQPGWVAPAERVRCARLVFERDRRRRLAAHAGLGCLLASLRPELLHKPYRYGSHGRPKLDVCDLSFNLSHSEGVGLVGLAGGCDVGVDVEVLRPLPDLDALADAHFTSAEKRELDDCHVSDRVRAFLRGWTRKEACLKALGTGLSLPASAVHAGLDGSVRVVAVDVLSVRASVEVCSLDTGFESIGAVARVLHWESASGCG